MSGEPKAPAASGRSRRSAALRAAAVAAVALAALAVWAMTAPVRTESRERLFEIPRGTWAKRVAGNEVEILPSEIHLTLGVKDILVLKNLDDVPQVFSSVLIMPGQSFKLPFRAASSYQFQCTAHASGQLSIVVDPEPTPGWRRLAWRAGSLARYLKERAAARQ